MNPAVRWFCAHVHVHCSLSNVPTHDSQSPGCCRSHRPSLSATDGHIWSCSCQSRYPSAPLSPLSHKLRSHIYPLHITLLPSGPPFNVLVPRIYFFPQNLPKSPSSIQISYLVNESHLETLFNTPAKYL